MSESGKVSLPSMTPERKEEIREFITTLDPECELAEWLNGLLSALEESQQRIEKLELYVKSLEFSRDDAQKMARDIEREKGLELFEAQQTIVRQREALKYYASGAHIELNAVNQFVSAEDGCKAREALGEGAKES